MSTTAVGGKGPRGSTTPPSLRRSSNRTGERIIIVLLQAAAILSVVITIGIVISLVLPALSFFREIGLVEFFTGTRWTPTFADPEYGVLPLIVGTLWTTAIGLLVAVPLGLGAAMFLSEYASTRVRRILKPVLEVLAGIPSVVLGFFALNFIAPSLLRGLLGIEVGTFSVLAAGVVLGVFIIPTIASLSEDAMSAVPDSLRQGSAALGANRMTTTLKVVFPAAISGIIAAIVLGISRAVGETMILAIAAGNQAQIIADPREGAQTMTGYIAQAATGENPPGSLAFNTLFAVGLTLFAITLLINLLSIRLVRRFREVY
ncbi:phosphate ABC transporter permease subunit PstC [Pseudonocardia nigra]|uniref:phosphate ABC transporter permease subunit PstC n=1 Tax=Pseudonocardia nigra TaxID=1921578 RepID=UPI001C60576F|nr:phosphate ABC transporter permease subunit PstC [Pseudonocardia nigra]